MVGLRHRGQLVGTPEHTGGYSEPHPAQVGGHYHDRLRSMPKNPPGFPTSSEPPLEQRVGTSACRLGFLEAIYCPKMVLKRRERYVERGGGPNIRTCLTTSHGELKNSPVLKLTTPYRR